MKLKDDTTIKIFGLAFFFKIHTRLLDM